MPVTFPEHAEKYKIPLNCGIWVTSDRQFVAFASLSDDHLCRILSLIAQNGMLNLAFAQRLAAAAQARHLDWKKAEQKWLAERQASADKKHEE